MGVGEQGRWVVVGALPFAVLHHTSVEFGWEKEGVDGRERERGHASKVTGGGGVAWTAGPCVTRDLLEIKGVAGGGRTAHHHRLLRAEVVVVAGGLHLLLKYRRAVCYTR